ncbi:MAG: glycosyltransferase [Bacteroidota bacterium]
MQITIDLISQNPLWIIPIILILSTIIQLVYNITIYGKILFYKQKDNPDNQPPVSVIICARDEQTNLENKLPLVLEQNYPNYEVIVVNDCSSDDSDMVLTRLSNQYPHLKTTEIKKDQKFTHGKKLAVTIGIKAAKNECLIFTDADCYPVSNNWISKMAENFSEDNSIVLGYGGYKHQRGLLNTLIRYDTLIIALQYLTYALSGFPYMGIGRNMGYKKTLFYKNKGFSGHYHIESGDDDIFINQTANKYNTKIQISKEAIVRSEPQQNFIAWFKQKKRHLKAASFYNKKTKWRLLTEVYSRMFFYASFILSLIYFPDFYLYIIGVFLLHLIIRIIVINNISKRLCEKYLLLLSPFYDLFLPLFNFIGIISNKIDSNKDTKI